MKDLQFSKLISELIKEHLTANRVDDARALCESVHPETIADQFSLLSLQEQQHLLSIIDTELAAEVFSRLKNGDQHDVILSMDDQQLADIINHMPSDDRVDLIKKLPEARSIVLLRLLKKAEREDIRKLGAYVEGSAGSIMSSDYASVAPELTAQQALENLRVEAPDKETIYYIYVIDEQRKLVGFVSLRTLITASPNSQIKDIMLVDPVFARVNDDQEEVARLLNKYDLLAIPVLNGNDALAGIITFDDVQDVMVEEATEDFHRMGGLAHKVPPSLINISMRDAGWWLLVRKRLPWLLVLVFMNIFSGAGIAYFEDTIEAVVALVFFLPLLIDSGGNAGSQAATLMVRALATGKAHIKDWMTLLAKEVSVAASLGLCMGLAVSLIGLFRAGPEVAVVVAVTMVCTVLFGSLMGMCLPFLLSKFKMDPATASAPLITSIADIGGVLIYFSIATWFLRDIIAAS